MNADIDKDYDRSLIIICVRSFVVVSIAKSA